MASVGRRTACLKVNWTAALGRPLTTESLLSVNYLNEAVC